MPNLAATEAEKGLLALLGIVGLEPVALETPEPDWSQNRAKLDLCWHLYFECGLCIEEIGRVMEAE